MLVRNLGRRMRARSPAAAAGGGDASISFVKLLCHFDAETSLGGGAAAFVHAINAGAPYGFTRGSGVNASLETVAPLLGAGSLSLPDRTGYARTQADTAYNIAGGDDFTIEFWHKPTAVGVNNLLILDGGANLAIYTLADGSLHFYRNSADAAVSAAGVIANNTLAKVALSRTSGNTRMFVGGTQVGVTVTGDAQAYAGAGFGFYLGAAGNGSPGLYDEFRLTVGVGRYTANYTPSATAFPDA